MGILHSCFEHDDNIPVYDIMVHDNVLYRSHSGDFHHNNSEHKLQIELPLITSIQEICESPLPSIETLNKGFSPKLLVLFIASGLVFTMFMLSIYHHFTSGQIHDEIVLSETNIADPDVNVATPIDSACCLAFQNYFTTLG